jgi:hypothetical protein
VDGLPRFGEQTDCRQLRFELCVLQKLMHLPRRGVVMTPENLAHTPTSAGILSDFHMQVTHSGGEPFPGLLFPRKFWCAHYVLSI